MSLPLPPLSQPLQLPLLLLLLVIATTLHSLGEISAGLTHDPRNSLPILKQMLPSTGESQLHIVAFPLSLNLLILLDLIWTHMQTLVASDPMHIFIMNPHAKPSRFNLFSIPLEVRRRRPSCRPALFMIARSPFTLTSSTYTRRSTSRNWSTIY
jgi:hypothetical protein